MSVVIFGVTIRYLRLLSARRYFRQARQELKEAQSDTLRQHEESVHLLGDIAKQHMAIEGKKDGTFDPNNLIYWAVALSVLMHVPPFSQV